MENKNMTAVDYFMNSLNAEAYTSDFWRAYKKAKEMEKEQMEKAVSYGISNADMTDNKGYFDFEQYYSKTYGNNTRSED